MKKKSDPSDFNYAYPLVSVLVISYNQKEFIKNTLESALNQDYPNFEVVVSDDASTDGTADLIVEVSKKYPTLKINLNNKNLGITKNCNVCLNLCSGKYIAILGGDDLFLPGKLSAQVKWLESDEKRVICGHDCEIFDNESGTTIEIDVPYRKSGYSISEWIKNGMIISATSLMVRASAIPIFGFDEKVEFVSDWKFCIDILLNGGECGYIPGIFSKYRRHSTSITHQSARYMSKTYRQSYLDQFYTLSYIEALHPEYARDCEIRRKKLNIVRILDSYRSHDYRILRSLLSCYTVTLFSLLTKKSFLRWFKALIG